MVNKGSGVEWSVLKIGSLFTVLSIGNLVEISWKSQEISGNLVEIWVSRTIDLKFVV